MKPNSYMRSVVFVGLAGATFFSAFVARQAEAATVKVNTTVESRGDGKCSLSEAVQAVNRHGSFDSCTYSGTGADIVSVPAGVYQENTTIFVTRSMTIQGPGIKNGDQQAKISGNVQYADVFSVAEGSSAIQVAINGFEIYNSGGVGSSAVSAVGQYIGSLLTVRGCWLYGFDMFGADASGVNLDIEDSLIEANTTGVVADATLTIANSDVCSNNDVGVAFYGFGLSNITNTTIAYNFGSGLYLGNIDEQPADLLTIRSSTVAFNNVPGVDARASNYKVDASIISDNTDGATNELDWSGHIATLTNSALKSTSGASIGSASHNLLNVDPMLFNGTNAIPLWIGGAYYTSVVPLSPGSPAIDFVSSGGTTDQRHFPRGVSGGTGRSTLFDIGAVEMDPHIQGETLVTIPALTGSHAPTVDKDSRYSNGQASKLPATGTSDFVTYQVPIQHDLTIPPVQVTVRVKKGPDAGIVQVYWSEVSSPGVAGTLHSLGTIDLYSSTTSVVPVTLPNTASLSTDAKYFRFKVTGKNSRSSGYNVYLDTIDFK